MGNISIANLLLCLRLFSFSSNLHISFFPIILSGIIAQSCQEGMPIGILLVARIQLGVKLSLSLSEIDTFVQLLSVLQLDSHCVRVNLHVPSQGGEWVGEL